MSYYFKYAKACENGKYKGAVVMWITVLLFVLGLVLICVGGDRLVDAAVAIAKKLGIPQIEIGRAHV